MKQLLPKLITNLKSLIQKKQPKTEAIQPTGISTEPATVGVASERELVSGIVKNEKVSHEDVQNLAKTFFSTDIPSSYFCFKGGGPYGVIMEINNIGMVCDQQDKLSDIFLQMSDSTMGTSLSLTVSIKDLNELLVPFFPKQVVFN